MAAVLLACQMLEDEIQRAVQRADAQMPIVWVDAGLHEYPDRLREELQRQIALLEMCIRDRYNTYIPSLTHVPVQEHRRRRR